MSGVAEENWLQDWNARDEFGVPSNMFGQPPQDFFGRLARIVMTSALLEHRLLSFYQHLKGIPQHEETRQPASAVVSKTRESLSALASAEDRAQVGALLDENNYLLERRNHYVHDLWPAQDGGRIYGWRFDRQATPARLTKVIELSAEEMQSDLLRFLDATRLWDRFFPLVSSGQRLGSGGSAA